MATREDVYLGFGRLAELAQLLETALGTALLAHDALECRMYVQANVEAAKRLLEAIEKKTLGASLSAIRSRFNITGDLASLFDRALQTRNLLKPRFFLHHRLAIEPDSGRDAMLRHMDELRPHLESAYQAAGYLVQLFSTRFAFFGRHLDRGQNPIPSDVFRPSASRDERRWCATCCRIVMLDVCPAQGNYSHDK